MSIIQVKGGGYIARFYGPSDFVESPNPVDITSKIRSAYDDWWMRQDFAFRKEGSELTFLALYNELRKNGPNGYRIVWCEPSGTGERSLVDRLKPMIELHEHLAETYTLGGCKILIPVESLDPDQSPLGIGNGISNNRIVTLNQFNILEFNKSDNKYRRMINKSKKARVKSHWLVSEVYSKDTKDNHAIVFAERCFSPEDIESIIGTLNGVYSAQPNLSQEEIKETAKRLNKHIREFKEIGKFKGFLPAQKI